MYPHLIYSSLRRPATFYGFLIFLCLLLRVPVVSVDSPCVSLCKCTCAFLQTTLMHLLESDDISVYRGFIYFILTVHNLGSYIIIHPKLLINSSR